MTFGNPLGFLALLGLPAIVLIHLLRVRARRVETSTLFLLDPSGATSPSGRKVDRLRSSPLLWLQLAAVIALAWVLLEPRWLREDSTQRVVVVVDGSASMSAFEEETAGALARYLPRVEKTAARIEWIVLGTDLREKTLYSGTSREEAMESARSWRALLGAHEMGASLSIGRSLAGRFGRVVLVTDHDIELPLGVELLAVGEPFDNVGFVTGDISEEGRWQAIVKNSGVTKQRRSWRVANDGALSSPETLELEAGELRFLEGQLPSGKDRLELRLDPDRFALDDRLHLVRRRAKSLNVYVGPSLAGDRFVERFLETLTPFARVEERAAADLVLDTASTSNGPAILFAPASGESGRYHSGPIVAERDPLAEGLDFQGLVVRDAPWRALATNEKALVWQGERPLISLAGDPPTLVVHFELRHSNADRVPGFVLALNRYVNAVRASKVALEQRNVETRQLVSVAATASGGPLRFSDGKVVPPNLRVPSEPGFFEVRQGAETLFIGAARFADVREADLTQAGSHEPEIDEERNGVARNSQPDPLRAFWLLALMGILSVAWAYQEKGA